MAHNLSSEDSLRAEAGNSSMDDRTIFNTPVPMVASTVSRHLTHGPQVSGDMGSFLDQSSTLTSLPNILVVDDALTCLRPLSYHQQSSSSDCNSSASTIRRVDSDSLIGENGVEASNSRSSLGILSLDNMPELVSSVLYYKGSPAQSQVSHDASRVSSMRQQMHATLWPQHHTESHGTFGQTLTPNDGMDIVCEADQVAERQRRDLSQRHNDFTQGLVAPPENVEGGRHVEQGIGAGGMNGALFRVLGQSEGEDDADLSVHEVHLDDDELMRFDEEFSDFDMTLTTNDDENQLSPNADRFQHAGFTDYLPHSAFDLRALSCDGTRGQRSAAVGQGSDGGDSGQHTQGEGQNLDDADQAHAPDPPDRLDSIYFQQQNPCLLHEGGDGEEGGEECSWRGAVGNSSYSIFGNGVSGDEDDGRSDHGSPASSQLDTDGEVDAIRREMESYIGSDDGSDAGSRPDLEGTNTEENDSSVRQAGEGDVTSSPVPGDGGGGGDGSSGHGSDENLLLASLSPPPVLLPSDTSDMARGLGYLLGGLSEDRTLLDMEDHPEGAERLRPMGEDILGETMANPRHVTFSSMTDIRNRTLSATSLEDDAAALHQEENERDEDETSTDMDRHMIASMFLTATSGSMSLTSDTTHNMEQSTFNLGDLCPSRPGVGHSLRPGAGHSLRPGAGHSLPDESQCHDSLNQSAWQNNTAGMSFDAPSRPSEGRQSVPQTWDKLWDEAGGNWMDTEDVWNLSKMVGTSERRASTDSINVEKAAEGSDGGFSDEFMSSEQGLAMLEQDKEVFFEEHIVDQEDAVISPSSADKLPPGWSFHNESYMSQPSWMAEQAGADPHRRVSIGTFMASRTEVLGGISGEVLANSRPTFGSKIVTPPDSHTPRPLLAPSLPDLSETGDGVASDDVRGSGVGSDVGDVEDNRTLCIEELCAGSPYDHQTANRQPAAQGRGSVLDTASTKNNSNVGFHQMAAGDGRIERDAKTEHDQMAAVAAGRDRYVDHYEEQSSQVDCHSVLNGSTDHYRHDSRTGHQMAAGDVCAIQGDAKPSHKATMMADNRRDQMDGHRNVVDDRTYRVAAPTLVDQSAGDTIHQGSDSILASLNLAGEFDESSFLNVSTITKLITSSSASAKADDLVGLILRASAAKSQPKRNKSCLAKDERKTHRSTGIVHSASVDSVYPQVIGRTDVKSQQREQRLSLQVEKTRCSESSRSAAYVISGDEKVRRDEKGKRDGTAEEQVGVSGDRRRSNVTRLPTYQRPTVASTGRQEGGTRTSQDGTERGVQARQGRRQGGRVGQSLSGETTPREGADRQVMLGGKTSDRRTGLSLSGPCQTVIDHAGELGSVDTTQSVQDSSGMERVNAKAAQLTGVKNKQGVRSVRGTQSMENVGTMQGGGGERVNMQLMEATGVNGEQSSDGSEKVNSSSARPSRVHSEESLRLTQDRDIDGVITNGARVFGVSSEQSMQSRQAVGTPERVSTKGAGDFEGERQRNNSRFAESVHSSTMDRGKQSVLWRSQSSTAHGSDQSEKLSLTDIGRRTSLTDDVATDWQSPRASLAMSRSQRQDTSRPPIFLLDASDQKHADVTSNSAGRNGIGQNDSETTPKHRSKQDTHTPDAVAMSHRQTIGEPVESFHHGLLPPNQQRASLVPAGSRGTRPALLTGQALASMPFATQYLDDITGMTASHSVYSESSASGSELESAEMVPRLSMLAVRDEFTSLPMSRPSIDSLQEYDMRESFCLDSETTFATRAVVNNRNGRPCDLQPVTTPQELRLPGVCCVGLSTHSFLPVHNTTTHWLHVSVVIDALNVDGQGWQVAPLTVPFMVKDKVIVEPLSTERVKVIFAPRQPGIYLLQLHLVANLIVSDAPLQSGCGPNVVSVQAIAEMPQIQVVTGSSEGIVDFGALPWGCQKCQSVTLVNRGRANLPVRLIISSNKSTWSCFSFGKSGTADVSMISNKSLPSIPSLAPSVANCMLYSIGNSDNGSQAVTVPLFFQGPVRRGDGTTRMGPPVEYSACVDVEVDTPAAALTLGSILLRATVGTARLHVPRNMDLVRLQSEVGNCQTQFIPLHNAGNIPLNVSVEVTDWSDLFVVMPTQLTIQPADQSQVMVRFEPKENVASTFESLLLLFVEPDGPAYEIPLQCDLRPTPRTITPTHHARGHTPYIFSNKHYLAWGGVPIGKRMEQSTILKNKAEHPVKLTLLIRCGDNTTQDFQLHSSSRARHIGKTSEVTLKPEEEYAVHVVFAPSRVRESRTTLQVRQFQPAYKYTIPLSGYGGVSRITLDDLQSSQKDHYWANIGPVTTGQHILAKVTVRNVGVRSAYISGVCFQDLGCKRRLPESRVSIQPNHFCLKPKQAQNIVLRLVATEKEAYLCQVRTAMVATVAFFYGDETSRSQFRRLAKTLDKDEIKRSASNAVRGVNFDLPYLDEFSVDEDSNIEMKNADLFYSSMRKVMLALIGESPSPSPSPSPETLHPFDAWSARTPASDRMDPGHRGSLDQGYRGSPEVMFDEDFARKTNTRITPPQLDRASNGGEGKLPSVRRKLSVDRMKVTWQTTASEDSTVVRGHRQGHRRGQRRQQWTIKPEQIILQAPFKHEEPVIEKVQLANYSDRALCYEFSWPAHCITLTQEQGVIDPRSSVQLLVSANTNVRSKGIQLPWRGSMHITCDGQEQELQVQIRDRLTPRDASQTSNVMPHPLHPGPGDTPLLTVTPPSPQSRAGRVNVKSQYLEFPHTAAGQSSALPVEMSNRNADPISLTLTSFAPFFIKRSSVTIKAGHYVRLPVEFRAESPGHYQSVLMIKTQSGSVQVVYLIGQCA